MKNLFSLFIINFFFLIPISAQKPHLFTLKTGPHISMIKGLETSNYSKEFGYHIGFGFEYLAANPIGIKSEILFESRSFHNYSKKTLTYKYIDYSNNVKHSSLFIPILFNYHLKRFSIEFGPHFDLLIHSDQHEKFHEVWTDGSNKEVTEKINNQHHFNKLSLGVNLGVNYKIHKRIELSTRFTQYYTNLGYEYPWQKYSLFKMSIGYSFGDDFEPRKINSKKQTEKLSILYAVINHSGFSRVEIQKVSSGSNIVFHFHRINPKYEITNILVQESSGFVSQTSSQLIITDAQFPFKGKLTLTLKQKINSTETQSTVEFEIYEDGIWHIIPVY